MAIDEDFCLLGMVSDEPDYKLCWLINKTMGTEFYTNWTNLSCIHRRLTKDVAYSIFALEDEDSLLTYRIIKNRAVESYFLDELKNLDYIIHIQGEMNEDKISSFIQGARSHSPGTNVRSGGFNKDPQSGKTCFSGEPKDLRRKPKNCLKSQR